MSAAVQFPYLVPQLVTSLAAAAEELPEWQERGRGKSPEYEPGFEKPAERVQAAPDRVVAFYRKHTEKILMRYLYSSLLVGRAPAMLRESVTRGWVSSRPVKSFEDSVIFVLDVEKCLARLSALERVLLTRVVLQNYSLAETALLLRVPLRSITRRHWEALDHLTQLLLDEGLLVVPGA